MSDSKWIPCDEKLPKEAKMAIIEDDRTASKTYEARQHFLHNLASIASETTFTLNVNYTENTVSAESYPITLLNNATWIK